MCVCVRVRVGAPHVWMHACMRTLSSTSTPSAHPSNAALCRGVLPAEGGEWAMVCVRKRGQEV